MRRLITTLCAAAAFLCGTAAGALAADLGPVSYASPEDTGDLTPAERAELSFLWEGRCRVLSLSPAQRGTLDDAMTHVREALADERLRELIRSRSDWMVADGDGWRADPEAGRRTLAMLDEAGAPRRIGVFAYERTAEHPCDLPVADGDIHAYTVDTHPVVLFHRAYLQRQVHAEDLEAGRRRLARTLFHETLHVLGFRHPGGVGERLDTTYANTVPVWLGCAIESWPDADYVRTSCHLPERSRPASAHKDTCDPGARVLGLRSHDRVRVKVRDWWTSALVEEVDGPGRRARVRWPEHGHSAWVDACRVQEAAPRTADVTEPTAAR